jgi:hypothetical protein
MKAVRKLGIYALLATAGLLILLQGQSLAQFPGAPNDDNIPSMGQFRIAVLPHWDSLMTNYPGYTPPTTDRFGRLESPILYDPATIIGHSGVHTDGSGPDLTGTPVGLLGTPISDAMLTHPPGFEGPPGTNEVHTEIVSMQLTGGPPGLAVRAGQGAAPPVAPISPGEVESRNEGGDFPAESFFDVFVEVDLPAGGDNFPGGMLFNPGPMIVYHDTIYSLPPTVVYVHGKTSAVPVHFRNAGPAWAAGDIFGWLVLSGHGANFTPGMEGEFEEIWWGLEEMKIPGVPSLTTYGLIVLLLLILLSGVIVIYRRKRAVAN